MNAAASQIGRPYCWDGGGANGPSHGDGNADGATQCGAGTVGFDCTGLTEYAVFKATGGAVNLSYHDSQQAEYAPGSWITSEGALQPGDVVYFGASRDNVSHAAIYAGVVDGQQMLWDANIAFWKYPDGVYERTLQSENSLGFVGAIRINATTTSGSSGFEAAFQANTTSLWSVGADGASTVGAWGLGMMAGTSPAITQLASGGYEIAFQANTGSLWTVGSGGDQDWGLGMMAGTSPAIAAVGNGYEVAFQANTGSLWTVGGGGDPTVGAWNLGMMAGTSPAIAAVGNGYEVAFEANTGNLWSVGYNAPSIGDWKLGMMASTSPSITTLGSGYEIAFQANTSSLWSVGGGGAPTVGAWGLGMMASTSPSITTVGSGYEIAFQANTSSLWTMGAGGASSVGAWGLGMS